jgi:hypothetical protein
MNNPNFAPTVEWNWVSKSKKKQVINIELSKILFMRPWKQQRYEACWVQLCDKGSILDPVTLHYHKKYDIYTVGEGNHRCNVVKDKGYTHIPALVYPSDDDRDIEEVKAIIERESKFSDAEMFEMGEFGNKLDFSLKGR